MATAVRHLISVDVAMAEAGALDVALRLEISLDYPGSEPEPRTDGVATYERRTVSVTELVGRLRSLLPLAHGDDLVHARVRARGDRPQRAVITALPWHDALSGALMSFVRGEAPRRPGLSLPLALSSPRGADWLRARLGDPVMASAAWAFRPQGHLVLAAAGDPLDDVVGPRTQLLVIEGTDLTSAPAGPFGVVQVADRDPGARIAFTHALVAALLRDTPLDAAVWAGLRAAGLGPRAVRLDLLDGDEHSLRPRRALYGAAAAIERATSKLFAVTGAVNRDLGLESIADPGRMTGFAKSLDFIDAAHTSRSLDTLVEAAPDLTSADAAGVLTGDVEPDRSAQLWLEDGGRELAPSTPLALGQQYQLCFQIAADVRSTASAARLDNGLLRDLIRGSSTLALTVALFVDRKQLKLDQEGFSLRLHRWGATEVVATALEPLAAGRHQIRAAVYHRGRLLQSLTMQVGVGAAGVGSRIDYRAVDGFAAADGLSDVGCSLWINQEGDNHWIGVYQRAEPRLSDLEPFALAIASRATIADKAKNARTALSVLEGDYGKQGDRYRFRADAPATVQVVRGQDDALIDLAREGRRMFYEVLKRPNASAPDSRALTARLDGPDRLISIARLDDDSSVPWSLMYDYLLDPSSDSLSLCSRHQRDRPDGHGRFATSPQACRGQADCPLRSSNPAELRRTVCPFGFWGFRHQIELRPRTTDGAGSAVKPPAITGGQEPRAVAATFAFPDTSAAHLDALQQLVKLEPRGSDRDKIMQALREGDRSLYYFFCHADDVGHGVELRFAAGQVIEPASLMDRNDALLDGWVVTAWDQHRPLVFLNACESLALEAVRITPFLDAFLGLGASGVIGTEVKVFTELGAAFATRLLARMITGRQPLGAALLAVRREMLGEGNPMGLAYSAYGSAALTFPVPAAGG